MSSFYTIKFHTKYNSKSNLTLRVIFSYEYIFQQNRRFALIYENLFKQVSPYSVLLTN